MKRNCIKIGVLSMALILLSACGMPGNGGGTVQEPSSGVPEGQSSGVSLETMPEGQPSGAGPETMPEGQSSDTSQKTLAESAGDSDRTDPFPDQAAGTQEALPGRDSHIDGEKEASGEAPAPESDNFLAAYRQTIEESDAGMVFSLIHLDGDESPELVAGDRGNDRYSIYTIKDGAVFCLVDSLTTAELTYFGHSGIIAVFASWNGGGDEGGYGWQYYQTSADKTLTDGDIPLLSYSYNAVYDEEGVYTGEGVTDYFYMGQETDVSVYNGVLGTLGITEDGGRPCLENAVFAEEMLDVLR